VGRSARIALGAIAAAMAAERVGTQHIAAVLALAVAALLVLGELDGTARWRSAWPLVVGAGLIALRLAIGQVGPASLTEPPPGDGPWELVVESTGSPHDGHQSVTLTTPPGVTPRFQVAATLPRYPEVVPGDPITVDGSIRPRPASAYGEYLARIGAVGTLTTRTLTVGPSPVDLGRRLDDVRRIAGDALARVLPEPEAGLAAGILIGLRDRVDRDLAAAFTTAGVSHVVAISGWNIAIVAAAVAALAGRLGRRRRSIVTLVAIGAYVAFAGASASVVRAALMAGVVLLARETGRAGRAAAALGWAAVILLVADPALIGDAGFQLSSLATAGLIAWATPLTAWIESAGRGRVPRWLSESLGVSLAAQAATLPIVLASFGRLAVLAPAVNLAVVPLVAPAMTVGLLAMVGGILAMAGAPAFVGPLLAAPGWVVLRILDAIVTTAASVPFASLTLAPPLDTVAAGLSTMALAGLVAWRRRRSRPAPRAIVAVDARAPSASAPRRGAPSSARAAQRAATLALVIAVAVVGGVAVARPAGFAKVTILDVGQGDGILVEGSRGGRLLVDGGPDPNRLLVALDARVPPWDRRIDTLILTHPHEDHVAGLALLLDRYRVGRVFEPGMVGPGPGYDAWLARLSRTGAPHRGGIAAGDRLQVDDVSLHVLWPIRGQVPSKPPDGGTGINNVSVVLLGQVGARRFLLMGDVEQAIDPRILAGGVPHVDLLKVAHHGSKTATTQPFVDAVRPRVAVASAGAGNPYGHPAKATLDRLAAAGARVLRTDRDGTVVVGFEPSGITVRSEGPRVTGLAPRQSAAAASLAVAFRCAIPITALVPELEPAPPSPRWYPDPEPPGPGLAVEYHRGDDGTWAGGGRLPPALPGSPRLVRQARSGGGRGGRLARRQDRVRWRRHRSTPRRGGRSAPRHRQGAAGRRSGPRPPPRRGLGGLAHAVGTSRAGPSRGRPPGDPTPRQRGLRTLGRLRVRRGSDRRLCRQARRPTAGADGGAVRVLAATLRRAGA
jgi:competence protein ComEC